MKLHYSIIVNVHISYYLQYKEIRQVRWLINCILLFYVTLIDRLKRRQLRFAIDERQAPKEICQGTKKNQSEETETESMRG